MESSNKNLQDKIIGGCKILKLLGKGAMGVVYLAEQVDLKRRVALKILDSKYSNDKMYISRFDSEAKSAAKLSNQHIVQIYDYGHQDDIYYMVNEFVDGLTVQQVISRHGKLSADKAVGYVMQATKGLIAAHKINLVHRDIKPDNLMLSKDDVIKIADFGLARLQEDNLHSADAELIMGTPFYMSPEQAKGLLLDCRSDIYSLGVTLYYLLVGDVPFDADTVVGVLLKHISADRPNPCAFNSLLPPVLGDLVMRMMDKSPDNRPGTPEILLAELEDVYRIIKPYGPPPTFSDVTELSKDQRSLFKQLPSNRVARLTKIDVSDEFLTKMITSLPGDEGVIIDMNTPYPVNTVVEVRFTVPGKDDEFSGLGLVRWTEDSSIGVTFVKVKCVSSSTALEDKQPFLSGTMAISALTATPLHQRLLRYIYTNIGQAVDLSKISGALGVGTKMLEESLGIFISTGLLKKRPDGLFDLLWTSDESLQKEIVFWISKHGLK